MLNIHFLRFVSFCQLVETKYIVYGMFVLHYCTSTHKRGARDGPYFDHPYAERVEISAQSLLKSEPREKYLY